MDATLTRLRECANRLALLKEEEQAEMERRDGLIEQARDEGASWARTASAARLAPSRCAAIIADR